MLITETERLRIREMDSAFDAEFVFALLNSPKFLQYIGDRNVRSVEQAADFIETRYRQSYRDHGYGLYTVELQDGTYLGMCGFVKRPQFNLPDLGFAFLPEHERKGYGFESATAMLGNGRDVLGFSRVYAITSQDNDASGKLLEKLGFRFNGIEEMPDGEQLKVFSITL
ncbi:MAG TPA: GNAT family N-acetyltransferase [Pyrinomonadaceae bacterium]|nr:GNAT family N-acetyltransferase [Pyrinomonadaceae bacterium]